MRIQMQPTVDIDDICCQFNTSIGDYRFADMAENGSYISFGLDEGDIEIMERSIEYYRQIGDEVRVQQCLNELALINHFRQIGLTESILILVCW